MYMVILLQGVRMMVGEINASFKGWQDRLIPDAIPAVDVAALLPFSPNAATLDSSSAPSAPYFRWASLLITKALLWYYPVLCPFSSLWRSYWCFSQPDGEVIAPLSFVHSCWDNSNLRHSMGRFP